MALTPPTGRQVDVIYLTNGGHQAVLGTAGSGKTLMAMHRAVHLADPSTILNGRTLFVTFTNSLATYVKSCLRTETTNVDVHTYGKFAMGYLVGIGVLPRNGHVVATTRERERFLAAAIEIVRRQYREGTKFFDRPLEFFLDEFDWLAGNGITELQTYLTTSRVGRQAALQSGSRQAVWKIREEYRNARTNSGILADWSDLGTMVRSAIRTDSRPRLYQHVIIDEAQDLSPEAIRSLSEIVGENGSVTFFADYGQQLHGQRASFASIGLNVRRIERFQHNYRNTRGIARLAIAISQLPHFTDSVDLVEPEDVRMEGTPPTLFRATSREQENNIVADRANDWSRTEKVGIIVRRRAHASALTSLLRSPRWIDGNLRIWPEINGIYLTTFHSAKGLEFDSVIMPYSDEAVLPDGENVVAFGADEAASRDGRLVYVGVTRARSQLLVTYMQAVTALLPSPTTGHRAETE